MAASEATKNDEYGMSLRLYAQQALLGNIPQSLRSVSVEYRGTDIACRFIFDGEPTEYDQDLLSCSAAEIISNYNEPYMLDEEYLAIPYPAEMNFLSYVVFLRHENPLPHNNSLQARRP
jgi:hypothetical protein